MPIVTAITQQKRSKERFSVFLDQHYAFGLDGLDLGTSGLRVGQTLTETEVERLKAGALEGKAYDAALRQLSYRRRSVREISVYLERKEYETPTIDAVISKLVEMGLIDDEAFARAWIADRQLLKPRSKQVMAAELAAKGVNREAAKAALAEVDSDSELATLINLAERKQKLSQYRDQQKLIAYLARQGYGYSDIKKALERLRDR